TAPETGQFRFFIRSDDASSLWVNATGAAIPADSNTPDAQEQGCCGAFEEPGAGDNGDGTFPTSAPISLTAGSKYGILLLMKEGGGGDWAQVAMRKEGDPTPAASLKPIRGTFLTGKGDTNSGTVSITQQPTGATAAENSPLTLTVGATNTSVYGPA